MLCKQPLLVLVALFTVSEFWEGACPNVITFIVTDGCAVMYSCASTAGKNIRSLTKKCLISMVFHFSAERQKNT